MYGPQCRQYRADDQMVESDGNGKDLSLTETIEKLLLLYKVPESAVQKARTKYSAFKNIPTSE